MSLSPLAQYTGSPIEDIASNLGVKNPNEPAGKESLLKSMDAMKQQNYIQAIREITTKAQSFKSFYSSVMGRGLKVDFFSGADILSRWSQKFPYRLLVLESKSDNKYSLVSGFRLPVNPQEISVDTPFAIGVTVTSQGILEEHNGFPLKQISIQGTTGVHIGRGNDNQASAKPSGIVGTVFAGTIAQASRTVSSVQSFINPSPGTTPPARNPEDVDPQISQTGYFQYHMLRLFLESYAGLKKSAGGRSYRLALEMQKDKQVYLITPNRFTTRKSAASPNEILYTLAATAWGTVDPDTISGLPVAGAENTKAITANSVSDYQNVLNKLENLRRVLYQGRAVVTNARADVERNIFGPINTSILQIKDVVGIVKSIADFPQSLRDSFQTFVVKEYSSLLTSSGTPTGNPSSQAQIQGLKNSFDSDVDGSVSFTSSEEPQSPGLQDQINRSILDDLSITTQIPISQTNPTAAQREAIQAQELEAQQFDDNAINDLVSELQDLSSKLEAGTTELGPLDENWDLLYSINDSIIGLYSLAQSGDFNQSSGRKAGVGASQAPDALTFWDDSMSQQGAPFTKPNSRISVPFPFRGTLEELALNYLGSADRWTEIQALNGLQAPYVDEDGFKLTLLSNSNDNIVNVSSKQGLYVGQTVWIGSSVVSEKKAKIDAINEASSDNYQILLSSNFDASAFDTADGQYLKAFLPYTVNSRKRIYIPLEEASPDQNIDVSQLMFKDEDADLIRMSKIDLLLDSNGDLAFTSDGFLNLAYGKQNLIQQAKLKVMTEQGSIITQPNFGAGISPGTSTQDLDLGQTITRIVNQFESDPRYGQPQQVSVEVVDGSTVKMDISLYIKGTNQILPLSFNLSS